MKIFKSPHSKDPAQLRYQARKRSQKVSMTLGFLIGFIVFFPLAVMFGPASYLAVAKLLIGEPIVNLNYVGLICGAGIFLFPLFLLAAYTTWRHDRIVVAEEFTPEARKVLYFFVKGTFIFLIPVPLVLGVMSWLAISLHDYHWCPQMSAGSNWDSWWVVEESLCVSGE